MAAPDELSHLVEEGIIDAVHTRLMSGKEATVYVVERGGFLGAAKVYRARDDRTFKKTSSYTEGRNQTRNTRDRRAMDKKTSYGRGLLEEGWQDMEFRALRAAFDAGVRVPEPFFLYENVLFMELVVDAQGAPAPRVADCSYTPEQATEVFAEIFQQVKGLLETGQVHGDLSAYNVLVGAAGPTIIDLPQVVDVSKNTNARHILRRDLRNVAEHLARFDARLLRFADCGAALYHHLERGTLNMVTGPEEGAPQARGGGGGRRGRDAERGRAGRDKGQGAQARRTGPPPRPAPPPPHQQRDTRGPAQNQSRDARGPAQNQSRDARGPAQNQPRDARAPAQNQPRDARGPAQNQPRDAHGPAQAPGGGPRRRRRHR